MPDENLTCLECGRPWSEHIDRGPGEDMLCPEAEEAGSDEQPGSVASRLLSRLMPGCAHLFWDR